MFCGIALILHVKERAINLTKNKVLALWSRTTPYNEYNENEFLLGVNAMSMNEVYVFYILWSLDPFLSVSFIVNS